MHFLRYLFRGIKKIVWIVVVAYMLGIHNVYKEEEKNPDDIIITVEEHEAQEDSAPKE